MGRTSGIEQRRLGFAAFRRSTLEVTAGHYRARHRRDDLAMIIDRDRLKSLLASLESLSE